MAPAGALDVSVSRFVTGYEQGGDCSVARAGQGVLVERLSNARPQAAQTAEPVAGEPSAKAPVT